MIATLVTLLIYVLVLGVLFWCVQLLLAQFALPAPFPVIIRILFILIGLCIVVYVLQSLLGAAGGGFSLPKLR